MRIDRGHGRCPEALEVTEHLNGLAIQFMAALQECLEEEERKRAVKESLKKDCEVFCENWVRYMIETTPAPCPLSPVSL